ncbi:MAG: hypothetical protein CMN28_05435 [Salinisphaeraceae bacterium]|nr:hypothetical protein [Salinisphaeraceae bacterium]
MKQAEAANRGAVQTVLACVIAAVCVLLLPVTWAQDEPIVVDPDAQVDIQNLRLSDSVPPELMGRAAPDTGPWWRRLAGLEPEPASPAASGRKFEDAAAPRGELDPENYRQQVGGGFALLQTLGLVIITFVVILFIWDRLRTRSAGGYREVSLATGGGLGRDSGSRGSTPRAPRRRPRPAVPRVPSATRTKAEPPPAPRFIRKEQVQADAVADAVSARAQSASTVRHGSDDWDTWLGAGATGWGGGYATAEHYDPEADDPLAAAHLYMSFGLYDQAASLLLEKSRSLPRRTDLRVALLQAYFKVDNANAFNRHFRDLLNSGVVVGADNWEDIRRWGNQLEPDNPVFEADSIDLARIMHNDASGV